MSHGLKARNDRVKKYTGRVSGGFSGGERSGYPYDAPSAKQDLPPFSSAEGITLTLHTKLGNNRSGRC